MRIQNFKKSLKVILLLFIFISGSCASSNKNYKKEYARVWKETIKSEAWRLSIKKEEQISTNDMLTFFASNEEVLLDEKPKMSFGTDFTHRYDKLVNRAYYKIIAEAEKADARLKAEYTRLNTMKDSDNTRLEKLYKGDLLKAAKKYEAHKEMLEGLKSWNIMSEYGTDDLKFFQEEHRSKVAQMIIDGRGEEAVMNYLVYKLADLYHFEE